MKEGRKERNEVRMKGRKEDKQGRKDERKE